jgi:glycosyltransferase involved in cell wall biosynthesis
VSERAHYTALVIQRRLTHYLLAFFETLRQELSKRNCELKLAYGAPATSELGKGDSGISLWGEHLETRYFLGERICWQPFGAKLPGVDIAVLTLENKLIYNLIAQYLYKSPRIALWGHGANLQGDASSLRESFKRVVAKRADWWFGYTDISVPLIERSGFPRERITVLDNAIDTVEFSNMFHAVKHEALEQLRKDLGLKSNKVGIYIGSLYEEKRIGFMLDAVARIHHRLPDFEFLIVGSGPQKYLVEQFCATHPWAKYLGVRKGQAKADVLALAQVMINPGVVGLTILDSFVCGVPIITTDCTGHGPEIAYLIHGENGLMTANSPHDYVAAVSALLLDKAAIGRLKIGCKASAAKYTVENMARNFADGVIRCLELPIYRGRRE